MSGGFGRLRVWLGAGAFALVVTTVAPGPVGAQDETTTTTAPETTTTVVDTTTTTVPGATTTTVPGGTTTTTGPEGEEGPDTDAYDPSALADLLEGYDEAVAMEAELLAQFELSVDQLNQLNQSMVTLNDAISDVETDLLDAEADLAQAEDRVDLAQVQLEDVERRLAESRRILQDQAVAAYISGGSSPGIYAFLSAETTQQLESATAYAGAVKDETDGIIAEYSELEDEARRLRGEAERAAADAADARDEVEEQRDTLQAERERQARAQADAFVAALAQQGLISDIEAQRGSYEERLRTLAGSSDSINTVLRDAQEGQQLADDTDAIFLPPVPDTQISSPFGPRLHPIFGTVRMHNGIDIDAEMGEPIRAAEDGTVVLADWQGGYGFTVVIDHGNGLATLYGHQSALVVHEGEEVEMGDIVGLVGSTGWSTGPHLHWEVRVFGNPTDPVSFLGGDSLLFD